MLPRGCSPPEPLDEQQLNLYLVLTDSIRIVPSKDAHGHAPTIQFIGNDTIEQEWLRYQDNKAVESTAFRLQRVEQL